MLIRRAATEADLMALRLRCEEYLLTLKQPINAQRVRDVAIEMILIDTEALPNIRAGETVWLDVEEP